MLELAVRLVFSLAVVVGLLLLLARFGAKRFNSGTNAPIKVLHRQSLSRNGSVALISVGGRVLVLGTTDQQVSLLTELDPDEIDIVEPTSIFLPKAVEVSTALDPSDELVSTSVVRPTSLTRGTHVRRSNESGAVNGSILSPQTWRQAFDAATKRVS